MPRKFISKVLLIVMVFLTPVICLFNKASGVEQDPSTRCTLNTANGFIICSVQISETDSKEVFKKIIGFAAQKAVGKAVSMGVKYLAGTISEVAGAIAGHAFSFFFAFITNIPLANPPTLLDGAFVYEDGVKKNLEIEAGTPVNVYLAIQPGTDLVPLEIEIKNQNGGVVFTKTIPYEALRDVWQFNRQIILLSYEPLVFQEPGRYSLIPGNASLIVKKSNFLITYPTEGMKNWDGKVKGTGAIPGYIVKVYIETNKPYYQGNGEIYSDGSWLISQTWPTKGACNTIYAELYNERGNRVAVTRKVRAYP